MLRRVAEILSRGVVLKRRLPTQFGSGPLFVSPDSGLKYYRLDLETADPTLFRMAVELVRSGDIVWDIGANVGLFTFAAAGLAGPRGRVIAVEPDTWLVSLLRRSAGLAVSGRAPVTVIPAAVSDLIGLGNLHIASRGRSANFMEQGATTQAGGTRKTNCVVAVTLDCLFDNLPTPRVLKIDVEGMEDRVLAGGVRLLTEARPKIWCEVSSRNTERVSKTLQGANYSMYNGSLDPVARTGLPQAVWDTVALPDK